MGCGEKSTDDLDTAISADGPFFDEVLTDVLMPSCGFDSCHGSGAENLTISTSMTAADLVNVESSQIDDVFLVVPGDAEQSYLLQKLVNADSIQGGPMPAPNGGLDSDRIQLVRDWINAGAE